MILEIPGFKIFLFLVHQEYKALVTGFPKTFLVKPGILRKKQEVKKKLLVKSELSFNNSSKTETNLLKTLKIILLLALNKPYFFSFRGWGCS